MPSLRQIVDELADDIGSWNDEGIKEQLKTSFKHHAATIIRQTVDKQRKLDKIMEVNAPCVSTERVDKAECCDLKSNCDVIRTEKIPDPVRFKYYSGITYVGTTDREIPYPTIDPNRAPWLDYEKWTSHLPRSYWIDNRIYFVNVPEVLKEVSVRMVPADPEQMGNLTQCNNSEPCFTIDSEYPAPDDVIDLVMKSMLNGKLQLYMNAPIKRDNEINQENLPTQGQE